MMRRVEGWLGLALSCAACGGSNSSVAPDAGMIEDSGSVHPLASDTALSFPLVYQSGTMRIENAPREWIPIDIAGSAALGELWVVQRLQRNPDFTDDSECTEDGQSHDCEALQGSTVTIYDAAALEPATRTNERARLIIDFNAWHFMRRPSAIAFGAESVVLTPDNPGSFGEDGETLLEEPRTYTHTFATCHEHRTGNFTDDPVDFIGPTLWTAEMSIYNGENGEESWSNGAHLDMVHATPYCMGIAYAGGNAYWAFNGDRGTIDHYDFQQPHLSGHHNHDDAQVRRYVFEGNELARLPDVPSNLEVVGRNLVIADTGHGRVVRMEIVDAPEVTGQFRTAENYQAEIAGGASLTEVLSRETLVSLWGDAVEPSGLAVLDETTLIVANHASGHFSIFRPTGEILRTVDTGLGAGLGGVTVLDGRMYFTHLGTRAVYRVDLSSE